MRTIWKFEIPVGSEISLSTPALLHPVRVEVLEPEVVTMWAEVVTDDEMMERRYIVTGTGHPVATSWRYIGTGALPGGVLVWHLWEIVE